MGEAILIIGGGVAGINAALNVAKYGTKVYLFVNNKTTARSAEIFVNNKKPAREARGNF